MSEKPLSHLYLGAACVAASLLLLFLWIPLDTDTGLIEKARRRVVIGDALAPSLAAAIMLIGGLILLALERRTEPQGSVDRDNLGFLARLLLVFVAGTALMRWSGPLAADAVRLFQPDLAPYRLLRDTAPWKYIGFLLGGGTLIAGLIALVEGRLTTRTVLIALAAVLAMIVIYDLPFDDLLLPPNGDV